MDRRNFIKTGVKAAAVGAGISIPAGSMQAADRPKSKITATKTASMFSRRLLFGRRLG